MSSKFKSGDYIRCDFNSHYRCYGKVISVNLLTNTQIANLHRGKEVARGKSIYKVELHWFTDPPRNTNINNMEVNYIYEPCTISETSEVIDRLEYVVEVLSQ